MIFFIRGEGYESLSEYGRALNDFRLAEVLFPLPKYQEQARQAAARVEARIYPSTPFRDADTDTERILTVVLIRWSSKLSGMLSGLFSPILLMLSARSGNEVFAA